MNLIAIISIVWILGTLPATYVVKRWWSNDEKPLILIKWSDSCPPGDESGIDYLLIAIWPIMALMLVLMKIVLCTVKIIVVCLGGPYRWIAKYAKESR